MSQRQRQLTELLPRALEAALSWQEPAPGHPALEARQAHLWDLMRDEARAADQELLDG